MNTSVAERSPALRDGPAFPLWLLLATLAGCILFFVSSGDGYWPTWARRLWNSGHFRVFAGLGWIGWRWLPGRLVTRWLIGLGLALIIGIAIELAQLSRGGREVGLDDVALDLAGAWVGLWWASLCRVWRRHRGVAVAVAAVAIAATLWAAAPVWRAGSSAVVGLWRFPVLFEPRMRSALERIDPSGRALLIAGADGLTVQLSPALFAGFKLYDMPSDWRDYAELLIVLENPGSETLPVTCRIHDIPHNLMYSDRYNRGFQLPPGMVTLAIDLAEVATAPADRPMAMDAILEVGCFASEPMPDHAFVLREMRLR